MRKPKKPLKKLWVAKVVVTVVFASEDTPDEQEARKWLARDVRENGIFGKAVITKLSKLKQIPDSWKDSIPWGEHTTGDDPSIREILSGRVD